MWGFCFRAYGQRKCCQGRAERAPEQACLEQGGDQAKIPGECSTVLHLECSLPGRLFSVPKFMSVSPLRLPGPLAGCSHSQRFCWMCMQQIFHAPATWGYVSPPPRTLANQRSIAWRVCSASSPWKSLHTCLTCCCWVEQERLCSVSQLAAHGRPLDWSQPVVFSSWKNCFLEKSILKFSSSPGGKEPKPITF